MERKDFLKNSLGFLGMAVAIPSLLKAGSDSNNGITDNDCTVSPSETEGPFPTKIPSSLLRTDIIDGRTGIPFTININVMNKNGNCQPLENAIVDIWHCDKDGNYSEYGGTGMQQTNYTSVHFLRGRQATNSEGAVSFTSIFPGWYTSRATHIHVHIYNSAGTSLLITQISFPEDSSSAVVLANAATDYGYTKGMSGYTYRENDNVFSDDTNDIELASVAGTVETGFVLNHTINVSGPVLASESFTKEEYGVKQNYPNPFSDYTTIPLNLEYDSQVSIHVFDHTGRKIYTAFNGNLNAGNSNITINRNGLAAGYYIYKALIQNENGTFEESKKMIVK